MPKYKVDETNNKLSIKFVDNTFVIPSGFYTERELKLEIIKQIDEMKEKTFTVEWKDGKKPLGLFESAYVRKIEEEKLSDK